MKVNFQQHGPSDKAPDQPSLVLIHGLFGSLDNLAVIRRQFERDYQVISVDLLDHGQSDRTVKFSFESNAQAVISLLDELNVNSMILVGHSLGGKVSMLIASKIPERVKHLVLLDISPVAYTPRHQNVIAGLTSIKLHSLKTRKDAQVQLNKQGLDAGIQAFLLKGLYQDNEKQWHWRFNLDLLVRDYHLLSDWPYSGVLFNGPTLFVKGNKSDYILEEYRANIIEQFPNATAKIINAGHWLHAEKPDAVNMVLAKFLPTVSNP